MDGRFIDQAKPNKHLLRVLVSQTHLPDLVLFLGRVFLIDTQSVDLKPVSDTGVAGSAEKVS